MGCEQAGYWKLVSRVFPENVASRRLIGSLGFREVGVYQKHGQLDGVWRDVIIVERLSPDQQTQAVPSFDSSVFAEELAGKMMERLTPAISSELHRKAADVLLELSPKLTDMKGKFKTYYQDLEWSNAPSKPDQSAAANTSFNDAFNFVQAKRLLIPDDIRKQVEDYLQAIKAIRLAFDSGERKANYGRSENELYHDHTGKAQKDLEALQPQYEKLHQIMQAFLGFPVK